MKLTARSIYPGLVEGEALVSPAGISFFGGVDPESGVVVERGHLLEGRSVAGKVLVFPSGKGSTVGSYTLYRLKANGMAPLAIINAECETITAVGCIIAEIPCVDRVDLSALRDGQRVRVDAAAGLVEILPAGDDIYPARANGEGTQAAAKPLERAVRALWEHMPEPLRGSEPGSFAEDTFSRRLPNIAQRALDGDEWTPEIRTRLQTLMDDMPHGRLRPLEDPGAPDLQTWQDWMQPYYGQTWLTTPWLPAEVYFFRRMLEATGYYQPGPGHGVDPFHAEKLEGLHAALPLMTEACEAAGWKATCDPHEVLARLLRKSAWGNQADLSVFPEGKDGPDGTGRDNLLIDQTDAVVEYLFAQSEHSPRIDILLDNVGVELAYDLLLLDYLFERKLAGTVVVHAKPLPTYVSDVTIPDLYAALAFFGSAKHAGKEDGAVGALARRLQARLTPEAPALGVDGKLQPGRLYATSHLHWAGALPNWKMPAGLRAQLGRSALVISKGDMNYRRWLGDLHWPFDTSFEAITAYRPAPLLALRVIKSNVLAGLPDGLEDEMNRRDPDWLYDGNWGLVQFAG